MFGWRIDIEVCYALPALNLICAFVVRILYRRDTEDTYALPITGVNHGCTSGYDRPGCCFGRLARWQRTAPAVLSRTGWVALLAHHVRVAGFGVRQPCYRASRTYDPARGTPLPILVTGMLDVLVTIIGSVSHESLPARRGVVAPGSCLCANGHGHT
ncbi:MAG: hypothetical protein KatS3mg054_1090 [Chloroflexus sp.]|nr:MAG: hypothetical protein KatS3mg054_1090 [Chloroflexus sp.]